MTSGPPSSSGERKHFAAVFFVEILVSGSVTNVIGRTPFPFETGRCLGAD
jgi:hypothetical protein